MTLDEVGARMRAAGVEIREDRLELVRRLLADALRPGRAPDTRAGETPQPGGPVAPRGGRCAKHRRTGSGLSSRTPTPAARIRARTSSRVIALSFRCPQGRCPGRFSRATRCARMRGARPEEEASRWITEGEIRWSARAAWSRPRGSPQG